MPSSDPHLGSVIAERYHPEQHIGTGLLGRTYLARDLQQDRALVALKILDAGGNGRPDFACFREDLLQLSNIRHPNLVRLLDFGMLDDGRTPYLVREFEEGMEVHRAITVPEAERALEVVARICHVLHFLHSRGVLHGNLKASNVFIAGNNGQGEQVRLSDYGLGRCTSGWGGSRRSVHISWLAPEVLMGHPASVQSDLYSLGVLAYLLLSGRLPFEDEDEGYLIQKSLQGRPDARPIEKLESGAGLAHVLRTMLAKNPDKRPTSAEEVLRLLGVARARDFVGIVPEEPGSCFTRGKFVGREREMRLLGERAAAVRESGRGAGLFIGGEAGSGKTRCLEEFRIRALLSGWRVFEASCEPSEDFSYGPFRRFLQATDRIYAGQPGHKGATEIFSQDHRGGAREFDPQVLATESVAGRFRDEITCEVVRRLCGRPTVFILHDFHWADEATCAVLGYLISDIVLHSVLVCVSYRTGDESRMWLGKTIESLERQARAERVLLEGLSGDSVSELILSMTQDSPFSDAISPWVFRTSGGNPFFIEEILKELLESGVIGRVLGRWALKAGGLEGAAFPSSVMAVLRGRVAHLAAPARAIAEWVAVYGRGVPQSALRQLSGQAADAFGEGLRELGRRQLICLGMGQDEPEVDFRHALIAEVIRNSVSAGRRRRMHRLVAEFIEGQPDRDARVNELALHCTEGRAGEKALRYALEAARRCKAEFANDRALHFLEYVRLRGQSLPVEVRCEAALEAADACCILGSPRRALRILKASLATSERIDPAMRARFCSKLALAYQHAGNTISLIQMVRKGLFLLRSAKNKASLSTKAVLMKQLAFHRIVHSRTRDALRLLNRALSVPGVATDFYIVSQLYSMICATHRVACDLRSARVAGKKAVELLVINSSVEMLPSALSNLGACYTALGRFSEAEQVLREAVNVSTKVRSPLLRVQALGNLAEALCRAGKLQEAVAICEDASQTASGLGNAAIQHACDAILTEIRIMQGELTAATEMLQRLKSYNVRSVPILSRAHVAYLEGWLAVELGHDARVHSALVKVKRLESSGAPAYEHGLIAVMRAEVLYRNGDFRAALALLDSVEKTLRKRRWTYHLYFARLRKGEIYLSVGRHTDAASAFRSCLRLSRGMQALYLECLSRLWLIKVTIAEEADKSRRTNALPSSDKSRNTRGLNGDLLDEVNAAYDLAIVSGVPELIWQILAEKAKIISKFDMPGAITCARKAVELIDHLASKVPACYRARFLQTRGRGAIRSELQEALVRCFNSETLSDVNQLENSQLSALVRISGVINAIREIEPLTESIVELFMEATHLERTCLFLRDGTDAHDVKFRKARHFSLGFVNLPDDVNLRLINSVFTQASPFVTADCNCDPRIVNYLDSVSESRTILCAPLKIRGEVLGVLYGDGEVRKEGIHASSINFLAVFTNMAANAIDNAQVHTFLQLEKRLLEARLGGAESMYPELIGSSLPIQTLKERIRLVALSPLDVLIVGECGTGKELVARALHRTGLRGSKNFLALDCGSLSESLAESELFGHKKGSFTGASENRPGLFESVQGGTLFLDEIGNLPFYLQGKLLRVLQEREVRRVGEAVPRKIDITVIAASNKKLQDEVDRGRFRRDLYYRLNAIQIVVPALRERMDDVPLLMDHFMGDVYRKGGGPKKVFSDECLDVLMRYNYPGNVRELKHIVESSYYLARGKVIEILDLPPEVRSEESGENEYENADRVARSILKDIKEHKGDFYNLIRQPFVSHAIDKRVLSRIIYHALVTSRGHYRIALRLMRARDEDYAIILQFFRRHGCYLDFRPFRRR